MAGTISLLLKLPVSRRVLPASTTREDLGELASDAWLADAPKHASPTFLREAKRGQEGNIRRTECSIPTAAWQPVSQLTVAHCCAAET